MKIIDGENSVLGRIASYVAKEALKGERIAIVNCEKIIISGNKKNVEESFERKRKIAENFLGKINFDVKIKVKSGGEKSQIESARLAIAKAIIKFSKNKDLSKAYAEYDKNLLVADVRRKESYKP